MVTRAGSLVVHVKVAACAPGSTAALTASAACAAGASTSDASATPNQRSIPPRVASCRVGRVNSPVRRSYGEHPDQHVDVYAPEGARRAVVAVLHGGFWRTPYAADLMDPLCDDLAARGYEVWNVEYRRVGADGGWPMTFDDVRAAVANPEEPFVTLGHSAGGHLALWL